MIGRIPALAAALIAVVSLSAACNRDAQTRTGEQAGDIPPSMIDGPLATPPDIRNISGVWWIKSYSPDIRPMGGGELPLTDEGQARTDANRIALEADPLSDESRKFCLPDGVPRILGNPYPFQIIQTPGIVTIVYELNRVVRRILLDTALPEDEWLELFPYYSGHSVAHWEGDTLVIETAGYNDKTFIDATGVPHSNQIRTLERVRKRDDGTLEIVITVTDPVVFSQPWNAIYVYDLHPGLRLQDYTCGEAHRDISHIPGVNAPN